MTNEESRKKCSEFLDRLEIVIRAIITDSQSDAIEDRLRLIELKEDFIDYVITNLKDK